MGVALDKRLHLIKMWFKTNQYIPYVQSGHQKRSWTVSENNNHNATSNPDSKVDAIAAVVLILSIASMMVIWVAGH
ncbi:hypothetical protein HCH_02540 [Hahella chejuensis KCTC 2396]|uniref:Uncharacterized protein n=1 Tax=Hahella chejuensis (strain KCTC 2396) TaxID=349521 RepID=Q2SJ33_HAHCH|nr:hypothetical protein HCH_02540 [Hahella chejuensis KCTC 2396]